MCNPAALVVAATAVTAVGKGMSAAQQAATYRYEARVADRNAQLVDQRSRAARDTQSIEQLRLGRRIGQMKGQQTAAMAANGVDLGFGTPLDVQRDTAMLGAEDYGQLALQGYNETRGFDISAGNYRSEAQAKRFARKGAITAGVFDVASTVLGGATQYSKLRP